jgi:hypothetical protein
MNSKRMLRAAVLAAIFATAPLAYAQPNGSAGLSSQYAGWAGGKSNADALISGLRSGSSITLVTNGPDRSVSLAGFTPARALTDGEIRAALSSAQQALSRAGVARPNAEQIQAALIGGEIKVGSATRQMAGVLPARMG